jgi:MoaA/NifB/PqqE/SkfB family radical SAM enzyme
MQKLTNGLRIIRDKLIARFFGFPRFYSIICVDVTKNCTLNCRGCYYYNHELDTAIELKLKEWVSILKELKRKHYWVNYAAWVGGEPLLRPDFLKQVTKIFPHNMIVTNGTLPLIPLTNAVYIVSLDGTKEFDEEIRGKDHYDLAKRNIQNSPAKVSLNMVINSGNYKCIENFCLEWSKERNVKQIYFSFHTPQKSKNDDLWLSWHLRDQVIRRLKILKKQYGRFIAVSEKTLDYLLSKNVKKLTDHCICRSGLGLVLGADGKKRTCVLGETADCEKCGNWEMAHATTISIDPDMENVNLVFDLFGA